MAPSRSLPALLAACYPSCPLPSLLRPHMSSSLCVLCARFLLVRTSIIGSGPALFPHDGIFTDYITKTQFTNVAFTGPGGLGLEHVSWAQRAVTRPTTGPDLDAQWRPLTPWGRRLLCRFCQEPLPLPGPQRERPYSVPARSPQGSRTRTCGQGPTLTALQPWEATIWRTTAVSAGVFSVKGDSKVKKTTTAE